jgi:hypothetical protein
LIADFYDPSETFRIGSSYEANPNVPGSWKPRLHISPHVVLYNPTSAKLDLNGVDLAISFQAAIQPRIQVTTAGGPKEPVTAGLHEMTRGFTGGGGKTYLRFYIPGSANLNFTAGEMRIFSLARDYDQNDADLLGFELAADYLPGNAISLEIEPAHTATVRGPTNGASTGDARYGLTVEEWADIQATDPGDLIQARFNWKTGQSSTFALMWGEQNYTAAVQKMDTPLARYSSAAWGSGTTISRTLADLSSAPSSFGYWDLGLAHSREENEPSRHYIDGNPRFLEASSDWEGATRSNHPTGPNSGPRSIASIGVSGSGNQRGWAADITDTDFSPNVTDFTRGTTTWGSGDSGGEGYAHIPLFDIPHEKPLSLGQFQHAALSRYGHDPAFALGNSYASIRIPRDQTKVSDFAGYAGLTQFDLSYLLNKKLWDAYFLSGVDPALTQVDIETARIGGVSPAMPSPHLRLYAIDDDVAITPAQLTDASEPLTFQTVAGHFLVDGAFNVNSTSVAAWTALLASVLDIPVPTNDPANPGALIFPQDAFGFAGSSRVRGQGYGSGAPGGKQDFFNGFRALDADALQTLATNIVEEVKARGPFPSLGLNFIARL